MHTSPRTHAIQVVRSPYKKVDRVGRIVMLKTPSLEIFLYRPAHRQGSPIALPSKLDGASKESTMPKISKATVGMERLGQPRPYKSHV